VKPDEPEHATESLLRGPAEELTCYELVVVDGPNRGASFSLTEGKARVGSAASCQLRLNDPTVSRVHFEATAEPVGLRVVDSSSTNGTFVDSIRIRDAVLTAGATIRVGASAIRVHPGELPILVPISTRASFGELLGSSVEMRRMYAILERVAPTDSTVLVQGETGTGKELAARAIHDASRRARGPFVAVDCGAIAETLIESELFGHVRGAFSGAQGDRAGLFEEADGGTLFLDEIGELPLSLQPKLLRALELREVRRVGANSGRKVDVRVVAATHRPLAASVNAGTFREDLFYRLAVVEVALPPLRARREDIVDLARHFFERFGGPDASLPPELVPTLLTREWPGNVRELRNFVDRAVTLGHDAIRASASVEQGAPPGLEAFIPAHLPLKDARAAWSHWFDVVYVHALLRKADQNVTRAAALAGVHRRSLQRLMVAAGLRADDDDEK
jgi:transcriptional regulator with PAS, ATPase and Fis domain